VAACVTLAAGASLLVMFGVRAKELS